MCEVCYCSNSRYHSLDAQFHATWNKGVPSPWRWEELEKYHHIVSKEGLGQISESSISFHLKDWNQKEPNPNRTEDDGIRRYHAILYGACQDNNQKGLPKRG